MRRSRAPRGFTLLELVVGIAVTSIILVAVAAAFIGAQLSYQAETEIKTTVEGERNALSFLERTVRLAGYGMEPGQAFDFAVPTGGTSKNNEAVVGLPGQVYTDDLAFRFRDPTYLRPASLSGTTVNVPDGFGADLEQGQLMQLGCATGGLYVAFRLAGAVTAAGTSASVNLEGAPFPTDVPPCTANATSYLMLVQEYRVRVVNMPSGGAEPPRPWLVAFRTFTADVSDVTGTNFDPIAADVESFQVSYQMNRPTLGGCCSAAPAPDATGNGNWIMGDLETDGMPTAGAGAPLIEDPYDSANRYTAHPANIRGVRIALGMRSSRPEPNSRKAFAPEPLEDFTPDGGAGDGYYRSNVTTGVRTPNLLSRTFFVPQIRKDTDTKDYNYWGG